MNDRLFTLSALLSTLFALPARAQTPPPARTLSALDVVTVTTQHSPTLHIALLQETQAKYDVAAEEALYVPVFEANSSYTHARSPSPLRGSSTTIVTTVDTVDLGAGISKTFALGTVLSATVDGTRSIRSNPPQGSAGAATVSAPQYNLLGKLSLTQPLLRGYGTDVGLATLRQARLKRTSAALEARQAASQLLHDTLSDYWELWYASEAVRINQASRDLSKTQQEQASEQVKSGSLAPADILQYATSVAQLEQQVVSSEADRQQKALILSQDMGDESAIGSDLAPSETPAPVPPLDDVRPALDDAFANSYTLKQQEALIAIAKDQAKIAGDPYRHKLELDAYVSTGGLGNGSAPPALEQAGQMQAVSAHVGLSYEAPLTDSRRDAKISSALLDVHIAEKTLEKSRLQLRNDVQTALLHMQAANKSSEMAQRTEQVAQAQVDAVKSRFISGTALAIEVAQAVDSLRRAQLSVQRARVDLVEAELDLLHLRGRLLERYSDALKRFAPSTVSVEGASSPM